MKKEKKKVKEMKTSIFIILLPHGSEKAGDSPSVAWSFTWLWFAAGLALCL